jgi:hypothetical protein
MPSGSPAVTTAVEDEKYRYVIRGDQKRNRRADKITASPRVKFAVLYFVTQFRLSLTRTVQRAAAFQDSGDPGDIARSRNVFRRGRSSATVFQITGNSTRSY